MDLRTMTQTPSRATKWLRVLLMLVGIGVGAVTQAGTVTYVYTDAQGTPLAKADANGNIIATFDYAPYGAQALGTPPSGPGYTGHVNDPDTGLVYMQARYYDPAVGRFLSVDPVGPSPGGLFHFNRYDYADNNPVVNIDPDGRYTCSKDVCGLVADALSKTSDAASKLENGSEGQKALLAVVKLFGKQGEVNGVSIASSNNDFASTNMSGDKISTKINPTAMHKSFANRADGTQDSVEYAATIAHEGQHGVDGRANKRGPITQGEHTMTERNAYRTQSYVNQGEGVRSAYGVWAPGISDTDRTEAINKRADESVALSCPNGTCE